MAGYIAARKWGGILPSAWDALSDYDRGWIIATLRLESMMEAHISKVQRDVGDEESGKTAAAPPGSGFSGNFRP